MFLILLNTGEVRLPAPRATTTAANASRERSVGRTTRRARACVSNASNSSLALKRVEGGVETHAR